VRGSLGSSLDWSRRLRWIGLAFVPSSLMLSVTTYLTTDIAAIPLFWVVPLAIYLWTFILVFARRQWIPHALAVRIMPLLILMLVLVMLSEATEPVWLLITIHLLTLFLVGLVCHGELAADRPPAEQLTEFYLWLSVGGVAGGIFNALIAPLIFNGIAEYPLVLVLACLCRPVPEGEKSWTWADLYWPLALAALTAVLVVGFQAGGLEPGRKSLAAMFCVPAVIVYTFLGRPIRFALGIGALFLASTLYQGVHGEVLYRARSFFGVHRVTFNARRDQHQLVHGNTVHGRQSLRDPSEPLAYFSRSGPIGQVFAEFSKPRVAIVGLGAGSLAAYGKPGEEFTFFEIDPVVRHIAKDPKYFTFLRDSQAKVDIVLGDARLTLQEVPDKSFDMLVIDAFSSDAIPLHLLTREALRIYLDKTTDNCILAFNISNRYLDLEPVLADLARDAGLVGLIQHDRSPTPEQKEAGKAPSIWAVMARQRGDLGPLTRNIHWNPLTGRHEPKVWTDDFSNIFSVFKWKDEE
jgi:hypothetical protein